MAVSEELGRDARELLESNGLTVKEVVSVDRDSILYLNRMERPRTVWIHRTRVGTVKVNMMPGFAAEPPVGWHDEPPV